MLPSPKNGLVIFDLDDTLVVSKSKIEPQMASLVEELLDVTDVCIISGGSFQQYEKQILPFLDVSDEKIRKLFLLPTSGTTFYYYDDSWKRLYEELLTEDEKKEIYDAFEKALKVTNFDETQKSYGPRIEDRMTQVTFSAHGQQAPIDIKNKWDPDKTKRMEIIKHMKPYLPNLEVLIGGTTSIDVTRKGIDKAYGVEKLVDNLDILKDDMIFVGDQLMIGGNDYPVLGKAGVVSIEVSGPEGCQNIIRYLIQNENSQ